MVYQSDEEIPLFTGCSHSGVYNMVAYARQVCGDDRVPGIPGGFYLFEDDPCSQKAIKYLATQNIRKFHPCHYVSLKVKTRMAQHLPVTAAGAGLTLEL